MNEEVERGRRDAITQQSEIDIVRVRRSELVKMRSLVENFLEANAGSFRVLERELPKRSVITNMEDVEYVLGYLRGLT